MAPGEGAVHARIECVIKEYRDLMSAGQTQNGGGRGSFAVRVNGGDAELLHSGDVEKRERKFVPPPRVESAARVASAQQAESPQAEAPPVEPKPNKVAVMAPKPNKVEPKTNNKTVPPPTKPLDETDSAHSRGSENKNGLPDHAGTKPKVDTNPSVPISEGTKAAIPCTTGRCVIL